MTQAERVRAAGIACAIGGALWVIVLMAAVVAPDAVYGNAAGFRIWEGLLIVVQALLLAGVVGLAWSGATGGGWLGRIGLGIALVGRASFLVGEVRSLATGTEDGTFLPLGALLTGVGMVLVGIAVLRARRWDDWHRYLPLLAGIYPFVAMFPLIAVMSEPPVLSIALWGIVWLLLGLALQARARAAGAGGRTATVSAYS
jgi:hypothetical protein